MSFTGRIRKATHGGGVLAALFLLGAGGLSAVAAKTAGPVVRLPLKDLGFPGYPVALIHAGASMATIHVLDRTHLLFTYGLRSLVPRLPGDDGNDHDRLVGAEVIEVPSGKVMARTEWHLHDYGRYLWSVGHGVFVMRSADQLSYFAPLRGLASGNAFERIALSHRPGHPEMVVGSTDGEIVTVELQKKPETDETEGDEQPSRKHTLVEFYRLVLPGEAHEPVELRPAGVVGSPGLLRLALDGDGYLWAEDGQRNRWSVTFDEYEGKGQNLTAVDSTCSPRLELLSRSEFAVMSCRNTEDAEMLTAYGFDGHENWEEHLGDTAQPPAFITAPAVGRFAVSRLAYFGDGSPIAGVGEQGGALNQEIRVYGTESGDLLLSVQCSPVMRTPENFDLSADGRTLAVLGSESINLYALPDLTAQDKKDLANAQTMLPPVATGAVVLRRITRPVVAEDAVASEETTAPQPSAPATPAAANNASPAAAASGTTPVLNRRPASGTGAAESISPVTPADDDSAAPRKRPTLLNPGETPEYQNPSEGPN